MRDKTRFVIACFISIIPLCYFRVFFYKALFRYDIQHSKVGFGTIINIDKFNINNSIVGSFNLFTGPLSLTMNSGSSIGSANIFKCGKWAASEEYNKFCFSRSLNIGKKVVITNKHYFDISGQILINDGSWISGYGSQFWTHGGSKKDINIIIDKYCYIGSSVCFAPGSVVASNTLVAMGSVVTKKFSKENIMIAGVPAVLKKDDFFWQTDL